MRILLSCVLVVGIEIAYLSWVRRRVRPGHRRIAATLYGGLLVAFVAAFVALAITDASGVWPYAMVGSPAAVVAAELVVAALDSGKTAAAARHLNDVRGSQDHGIGDD